MFWFFIVLISLQAAINYDPFEWLKNKVWLKHALFVLQVAIIAATISSYLSDVNTANFLKTMTIQSGGGGL